MIAALGVSVVAVGVGVPYGNPSMTWGAAFALMFMLVLGFIGSVKLVEAVFVRVELWWWRRKLRRL